jgi:hypothetical protein
MMQQSIMKGILIYQKSLTPSANKVRTIYAGRTRNGTKVPFGVISRSRIAG